jgi:N6-adenosine-specific RNA methylase IME4/predicted DNA-binding protein (UPF0251 family)
MGGGMISPNPRRRYRNESQRAMCAARVATMGEGRPSKTAPIGAVSQDSAADMLSVSRRTVQRAMCAARVATLGDGVRSDRQGSPIGEGTAATQADAAAMFNVGKRTVERARKVLDKAVPEVVAAVDAGNMTVTQATKVATAEPKIQKRIVAIAKAEKISVVEASRKVKADEIAKAEIKKPSGRYRVIYADPPWSYGNRMPPGTTEPRDHYPTMEVDEICALPIKNLAQDNAVLFLWATSPMVPESLQVIQAWGFKYKASFVWDKVKHNMGHYNSVRHEFLWICTRGSCQPDVRKLFDSVITEERREHSKKPEVFYEIIETIYPKGKRVELFAREARDGWDRWGLEAKADVA